MLYYMATSCADDRTDGLEQTVPDNFTADEWAACWLRTWPNGSIRVYRKVQRAEIGGRLAE